MRLGSQGEAISAAARNVSKVNFEIPSEISFFGQLQLICKEECVQITTIPQGKDSIVKKSTKYYGPRFRYKYQGDRLSKALRHLQKFTIKIKHDPFD